MRVGPWGSAPACSCPTLSPPKNSPVPSHPPGHGGLRCGKGEQGDAPRGLALCPPCLGSFILDWAGSGRAGCCSSTLGLGARLVWGYTIPSVREGRGVRRQPRALRGRTGCVGMRRRRRRRGRRQALASSWASRQDQPCFLARKAAAAALTQPRGAEPDFKCRGWPRSSCFARLGELPTVLSLPRSGTVAAASTGTGRGLTVHQ